MPDPVAADANTTVPADTSDKSWMSDVQRAIALALISTFAICAILPTFRIVLLGNPDDLVDMAKTLQAALVNMSLIALGYFFGSNMSQVRAAAGQQKIVEKLTSTTPPGSPGPVAPVPAPVTVAWWSLLTEAEKTAITAAAATDPKVKSFVTAAAVGKATPDDVDYLVSKGLLTADRGTAIKAL